RVVPIDQTIEALHRRSIDSVPSSDDARSIARELKAGRYVVGHLVRTPTGRALFADYRDVSIGSLHSAQVDLPVDSARVASAFIEMADSLVLRGISDGTPSEMARGSRNLPATQTLIR